MLCRPQGRTAADPTRDRPALRSLGARRPAWAEATARRHLAAGSGPERESAGRPNTRRALLEAVDIAWGAGYVRPGWGCAGALGSSGQVVRTHKRGEGSHVEAQGAVARCRRVRALAFTAVPASAGAALPVPYGGEALTAGIWNETWAPWSLSGATTTASRAPRTRTRWCSCTPRASTRAPTGWRCRRCSPTPATASTAFNYGQTRLSLGRIDGLGDIPTPPADYATFVNQVLARTHASQVDLVGHSQGGHDAELLHQVPGRGGEGAHARRRSRRATTARRSAAS